MITTKEKKGFICLVSLIVITWIIVGLFGSLFSCNKDQEIIKKDTTTYNRAIAGPVQIITTWDRYLYVDSTQGIYKNQAERVKLLKYAKKYGFTGFYFYDLSGIVASSSNDAALAAFLKQCSDSGIVIRAAVGGSKTTFTSGGVKRFQSTQTNPSKKFTR